MAHAPVRTLLSRAATGLAITAVWASCGSTADEDASAVVLRRANLELGQRLRPQAVDRLWSIQPTPRDVAAEFETARDEGAVASWLKSLPPPFPEYAALQSAEQAYQAMVDAGGWKALPPGPDMRQGERSHGVILLRKRLRAEGYSIPLGEDRRLFDDDLRVALAAFQVRHGLVESGALTADTRSALNVSAKARLCAIAANLERWRWAPRPLPPERLEVDIPAASARLYAADASVLDMRVAVGDPKHRTPILASSIEAVVFNPPWNVPPSIAAKELLPKGHGYLRRNHFVFAAGRLRQKPGPDNALGAVKFEMRNGFDVYLHDTPGKGVFARRKRAVSHGCIRLQKPRELAALVLKSQGWTPEQIDQAIATTTTHRVEARPQTPVYVFYWTVVTDADGQAVFRPDIYGWDQKLMAALAGRAALSRTETGCAEALK